ncbi:Mur ligase family protein [Jatrophihabitans sp. YIM 134969]
MSRVGIWGFGREGAAAWRWVTATTPDASVVVVDDDPDRVHETAPEVEVAGFDALLSCATVWVSPGIRPADPRRAQLREAGVVVRSGTDEFMTRAATRTVGVTGTKGKSTTSSFVRDLVVASGAEAELAGNIGVPLLDLLDPATGAPRNDRAFFVIELSSYQCASLDHSPRVAVVTQLYADHLAEHGTLESYWEAKSRIFSEGAQTLVTLPETADKLRTVADVGAVPEVVTPPELPDLSTLLPRHVRENLRVAVAAAGALLGATIAPGVVAQVAAQYRPLPHRQAVVGEAGGLLWVDDALATTQESVLAALDAFPERRVAVLLGGKDRGQPLDRLVPALHRRSAAVLLLGETTARFAAELTAAGVPSVQVGTVDAGVAWAADHRTDLDVVLLSPGAASYDQFRDHAAKGAAFAAAVTAVAPVVP